MLAKLLEYIQLIERWTVKIDLVSQESGLSMVNPHIVDSAAGLLAVGELSGRCIDVGSGAGLPGIVWAVLEPEKDFVLVEPRQRRVDFLREVKRRLQLENVLLINKRSEEIQVGELSAPHSDIALVACRALGGESNFVTFAERCLSPGGRAVILAGPSWDCPVGLRSPEEILEYQLPADELGAQSSRKLVVWRR
jgi:16S rRNA (guanine527-N7)-methyltransferase